MDTEDKRIQDNCHHSSQTLLHLYNIGHSKDQDKDLLGIDLHKDMKYLGTDQYSLLEMDSIRCSTRHNTNQQHTLLHNNWQCSYKIQHKSLH